MKNIDFKKIDYLLNQIQVKPHNNDLEATIINKAKKIKQRKSFGIYIQLLIESFKNSLLSLLSGFHNTMIISPKDKTLSISQYSITIFVIIGFLGGIIASNLSIGNESQLFFSDNFVTEILFDEGISL